MFNQTLSGLKTINSNYIYNSQDFYNYGNVYISGSLISPTTDLLIYDLNNLIIQKITIIIILILPQIY